MRRADTAEKRTRTTRDLISRILFSFQDRDVFVVRADAIEATNIDRTHVQVMLNDDTRLVAFVMNADDNRSIVCEIFDQDMNAIDNARTYNERVTRLSATSDCAAIADHVIAALERAAKQRAAKLTHDAETCSVLRVYCETCKANADAQRAHADAEFTLYAINDDVRAYAADIDNLLMNAADSEREYITEREPALVDTLRALRSVVDDALCTIATEQQRRRDRKRRR